MLILLLNFINFSAPEVQAALISGLFSVLSALIAAIAAAIIGRTLANRQRLAEKLDMAIRDIAFLLEVEKSHCDYNKEKFDLSRKNLVRDLVRQSTNLDFSGQFTPGRIRSNQSRPDKP